MNISTFPQTIGTTVWSYSRAFGYFLLIKIRVSYEFLDDSSMSQAFKDFRMQSLNPVGDQYGLHLDIGFDYMPFWASVKIMRINFDVGQHSWAFRLSNKNNTPRDQRFAKNQLIRNSWIIFPDSVSNHESWIALFLDFVSNQRIKNHLFLSLFRIS